MPRIWIIKLGDAIDHLVRAQGDFEDWIRDGMGLSADEVTICQPARGDQLPPPEYLAGAVVSGSHDMVTDRAEWSERTGQWMARAVQAGLPVLGICYGHQLLADVLGGEVRDNPNGREYGTVPIRLQPEASHDPLFAGLPDPLPAQCSHVQSVTRLPEGAVRLATSAADGNHAFRVGACAWGVQFHPEFSARAARAYLDRSADKLRAEGQDPDAIRAGIAETPEAASLLRRFVAYLESR